MKAIAPIWGNYSYDKPMKKKPTPKTPTKSLNQALRRLKHLAAECQKNARGWQKGTDQYKLQKRAQYRAFKQAAQIVRDEFRGYGRHCHN